MIIYQKYLVPKYISKLSEVWKNWECKKLPRNHARFFSLCFLTVWKPVDDKIRNTSWFQTIRKSFIHKKKHYPKSIKSQKEKSAGSPFLSYLMVIRDTVRLDFAALFIDTSIFPLTMTCHNSRTKIFFKICFLIIQNLVLRSRYVVYITLEIN